MKEGKEKEMFKEIDWLNKRHNKSKLLVMENVKISSEVNFKFITNFQENYLEN